MAKLVHQSLDCTSDRGPEVQTKNSGPPAADKEGDRVPLSTANLFGRSREIEIEHRGRRYCLRITRKNGLILNAVSR